MENKYFTPDMEDFHIGYECEISTPTIWKSGKFPEILELNSELDEFGKDSLMKAAHAILRVLYLTKEQIEAEGWKLQNILLEDDDGNDMFSTGFTKTIDEHSWYELVLQEDNNLFIQYKWYRNSVTQLWRTIYYGKCKDINTFRKICKLLEIY